MVLWQFDTTKGDTWAKIDASCDIALEDSNCDLNISWEYVNKNQDYKICHTDKSTNVTKMRNKSGQKGSGIFGQKKYDQSTVVSLRDMSDNVLIKMKFYQIVSMVLPLKMEWSKMCQRWGLEFVLPSQFVYCFL